MYLYSQENVDYMSVLLGAILGRSLNVYYGGRSGREISKNRISHTLGVDKLDLNITLPRIEI